MRSIRLTGGNRTQQYQGTTGCNQVSFTSGPEKLCWTTSDPSGLRSHEVLLWLGSHERLGGNHLNSHPCLDDECTPVETADLDHSQTTLWRILTKRLSVRSSELVEKQLCGQFLLARISRRCHTVSLTSEGDPDRLFPIFCSHTLPKM